MKEKSKMFPIQLQIFDGEQGEVDIQAQVAEMAKQMAELQSTLKSVTEENERNKKVISTFDENLAKELDKLKPKEEDEPKVENPVVKDEINTQSVYDNLMNVRKEQDQQLQKEKEEIEKNKIFEENRQLKFKLGIGELIDKEPYLADFIKEGVDEKRFQSIEDVKMGLTPSVKKALEYTYKKAQEYKKEGKDPMEMYSTIGDATNGEIKAEKRKKNLENWAKLLK